MAQEIVNGIVYDVVRVQNPGSGGGGGTFDGTVTVADGADATAGSKADAPVTDPTATASQISLMKGLLTPIGTAGIGAAPSKAMLISGMYYGSSVARTAGQASALATDIRGNMNSRVYGTPVTGIDGFGNALSMFSNEQESTGGTHLVGMAPFMLNESGTWDRFRGDVFGMRVQPSKRAGTGRSKLVTTTSTELIPANSNSWYMKNDSTAVIYYNVGAPASATPADNDGSMRLDPGEFISSREIVDTGAINVVVASGTAQIKARST